jgi:hypothetical protein
MLPSRARGAFLIALVAAIAPAPAAAAKRLRVVVRAATPEDLSRATRVRGQASDLPVEIVESPSSGLEGRLPDQIAAADVLARQLSADVVVWFARGAAQVFVLEPAPGHLLTVAEDTGPGAPAAGSARHEAIALRLRRVFKTLLDGGVVGVPRDRVTEPPAAAPAPPVPPAAAATAGASAPAAADAPLRVRAALGAAQLFDGPESVTGLGLETGLGVGRTEWTMFLDEYRTRAIATRFDPASLARRGVGLAGGWVAIRHAHVRVVLSARAALARLAMEGPPGEFNREDEDAVRPLLGAGARLEFPLARPGQGRVRLGFWAGGALDVMWDPPTFTPDFARRPFALSALEPRVGVGLSLEGG